MKFNLYYLFLDVCVKIIIAKMMSNNLNPKLMISIFNAFSHNFKNSLEKQYA